MRKIHIFVIWSNRKSLFRSHPSFLPLSNHPPSFINEIGLILSKQYCISPHRQAFLKQPYLAKVTTFPHTFEKLNNANKPLAIPGPLLYTYKMEATGIQNCGFYSI